MVHLSSRELEVLCLLATGMVNKEVADTMNLSKQTIDTHRRNMLAKTGCRTTLQLMHLATKAGWVS